MRATGSEAGVLPHLRPGLYRRPGDRVEQRKSWAPPVPFRPVIEATEIPYIVATTRTGSIKSIDFDVGVVTQRDDPEHVLTIPAGLKASMRLLVILAEIKKSTSTGPLIYYGRGYEINATGEMRRKPIWEHSNSEESGKPRRTKVGEAEPEPVDAFVVRLRWHNGLIVPPQKIVAAGSWIDGKPDTFGIAPHAYGGIMSFADWKARIKAMIEEADEQ